MKRTLKMLALGAVATSAALPLAAMPIGLRTAAWGVSAANGRTAVAKLLPESSGNAGFGKTLAALADDSVAANIADSSEYEEFREWALDSGARADTLTSSTTTWLSFATGSPVLVAEPKDGDLSIDEVSPLGADGKIEVIISLKDVAIDKNALETRLKSVFGVVGGTELDESKFLDIDCDLSLSPTDDGRIKASVTPKKDESGDSPRKFFLRAKMK